MSVARINMLEFETEDDLSKNPDKKSAEEALTRRDKHFKTAKIQPREAWYIEGKVVQRHVK